MPVFFFVFVRVYSCHSAGKSFHHWFFFLTQLFRPNRKKWHNVTFFTIVPFRTGADLHLPKATASNTAKHANSCLWLSPFTLNKAFSNHFSFYKSALNGERVLSAIVGFLLA